jgi:alcohol dehydrogenase YqhD (iron-dependent ADH family)
MKNFEFYNPTKIYFGQGEVEKIGQLVKEYGRNVLLVYGKQSIKKSGLYDQVITLLKNEDLTIFELSGIDPNPRIDSVREGGNMCKEHNIDFILAVGGGSVIDASKGISVAAKYDGDPWDFYSYKVQAKSGLPFGTILTLSATGSEMNKGSVITNLETKEKNGWSAPFTYPRFSILDPTLTYTVNAHQTACGIVDSLTHIYEFYFSKEKAYLNDRIVEGIMKTIIHFGPIAMKNPTDYEARANLMFSSTLALNGLSGFAKTFDGFLHKTEHVISAHYDIAHADGLSILTPHWMNYMLNQDTVDRFFQFAVNVFDLYPSKDRMKVAKKGIEKVTELYKSLGMPIYFDNVGITNPNIEQLASESVKGETLGHFSNLMKQDVIEILKKATR